MLRNIYFMAMAAFFCAACASSSMAAGQGQYCPGAKSIDIQYGDLSVGPNDTNIQVVIESSNRLNEVNDADDAANDAAPTVWSGLQTRGHIQMLCYSDADHRVLMGKEPLPDNLSSCSQNAVTKEVTCKKNAS